MIFTHIFVTHDDPDHYWHTDRVAKTSNAPVICNKIMVRIIDGIDLMLGPRDKGLAFTTVFNDVHTLCVDETIEIDDISITGIKTTHGELVLKLGPFSKTVKPGPDERIGWGASVLILNSMARGSLISVIHCCMKKEWQTIVEPDVLMIPIGGKAIHNTMDAEEALQAV